MDLKKILEKKELEPKEIPLVEEPETPEEEIDEEIINHVGAEVEIIVEHKGYDGKLHKVGERANLYTGATYGCLGSNERALIYNKKYPFLGTDKSYFKIVE